MILVSVRFDGGMAAVYRNAHGTWLGAGPAGEDGEAGALGGTMLNANRARVGIGGGRVVVGGLLAPGASRVVVEGSPATTGEGAWIAILDVRDLGFEFAVRYEADDGTIVRPDLPPLWTRERVSDADVPCPACGALTWERVTPTDNSRGIHGPPGGPMQPTSAIVCSRCGHEVSEGGWSGSGRLSPGGVRAFRHPLGAFRRWRSLRLLRRGPSAPTADELDFPVYALVGAAAEPAGHGWDPAGVHSVTMRSERVGITTQALRHSFLEAADDCAFALSSVIHDAEPADWGRGSNAACSLRLHAHERAVAARVARAEALDVELAVDGAPVPFAGLRDPAGWAAVGATDEVRIVISASGTGPEAVALRRL